MSTLTVLNVVPDERFGGPQNRILRVAEQLKEKDIKTIVVMPQGDDTYTKMLRKSHIPFYQLRTFRRLPNPSNIVGVTFWFIYFIPCIIVLIRIMRRHNVDIVHVNGGLNVQVSLAAKISRKKLLWHLNDVRKLGVIKPFLLLLLRLLPDKVVGASSAVERCYFDSNATGKMDILYPPVDTSKFYPSDLHVKEYREEFGINSDERVVGIVGNMNPFKGYEYFLPAADFIRKRLPKVKFLIVGKRLETHEAYWQRITALIDNLKLKGDIVMTSHRTDIHRIMNVMDVFVLSSIYEAAPIVVLEAMACARPIVATRVGGVPELVVEEETGVLIPPREPEAIAKAVLGILDNLERSKQMGENARRRVIDNFDITICADRHEEIYKQLLLS